MMKESIIYKNKRRELKKMPGKSDPRCVRWIHILAMHYSDSRIL